MINRLTDNFTNILNEQDKKVYISGEWKLIVNSFGDNIETAYVLLKNEIDTDYQALFDYPSKKVFYHINGIRSTNVDEYIDDILSLKEAVGTCKEFLATELNIRY